ncbi:MAG TPA: phospholipid carrier-dependent glycosyltransferase [Candidatus Paceibacterota bacterium]
MNSAIIKKHWPLIILLALAIITRFWNLGEPPEVVFDEVHFGKFVSAYFTNEYYFDIHPPLGKLMIAAAAKFSGFTPNFDFDHIGETIGRRALIGLRFLPALFGSLSIGMIYLIIIALGYSRKAAFFGGWLMLFDNAYLVESKFVLVDMFLIFFGATSLLFLSLASKASGKKSYFLICLATAAATLAASIKWTGVAFIAIIFFYLFLKLLKDRLLKKFFLTSFAAVLIALFLYVLPFIPHFSMLKKSGPGDAYMSAAFQKTLVGNKISTENPAVPLNFSGKFTELNRAMYNYNSGLKATHPDGSKWNNWPFLKKPVYYWTKALGERVGNIYLFGNPIVWWIGFGSLIAALLLLTIKKTRRKLGSEIYLLIFGYFINLLPFMLVARVAFLYHYLPALMFSILIASFLAEKILTWAKRYPIASSSIYAVTLAGILAFFLIISPLSYGFFIPKETNTSYQNFLNRFR